MILVRVEGDPGGLACRDVALVFLHYSDGSGGSRRLSPAGPPTQNQRSPTRLWPYTFGMATMAIKSTYSLDAGTVRLLEGLARRWNVSTSEALRRAIQREAGRQPAAADARLRALRALQKSVAARGIDLDGWEDQAAGVRSASFRRLSPEPR